eukprot:gene2365-2694_t
MSLHETFGQPLLTFPDAEKSPLSIRAKALVFVDPRSRQLREDLENLAPLTRVGAHQPSPVDVRLVAATSIDLAQAVAAGKFHERLFHYLSEGQLELPALRERVGDILSLAEYFLGIYSQRLDLPVPLISDEAQRVLEHHSWPGNTRELENVIHFALLVSSGDEILPEHLNLPVAGSPVEQVRRILGHASAAEVEALKSYLKEHAVL